MNPFNKTDPQYWNQIFEQSPIGIALVNTDGAFIHVNPAFAALTGYSQSELEIRTFQSITHPEDLDADMEMVHKLLNEEIDHYEMIKRYLTKTNKVLWIRLTVHPFRKETDVIDHFVAHIIPVSHGERMKRLHEEPANEQQRPTITIWEFVKDNWKVAFVFGAALVGFLAQNQYNALRVNAMEEELRELRKAKQQAMILSNARDRVTSD